MPFHKWLMYTVVIGLLPIIMRLFIAAVVTNPGIAMFATSDVISYGLVLSITNMHGLQQDGTGKTARETYSMGFSALLIVLFALMFALALGNERDAQSVDTGRINTICVVLALVTTVVSGVIWIRMPAPSDGGNFE